MKDRTKAIIERAKMNSRTLTPFQRGFKAAEARHMKAKYGRRYLLTYYI